MGAAGSAAATAAAAQAKPSFATFPLDRAAEVVDGIPPDRRIVLLGESTHGTEEFYRIRAAVTRRLVEERGFTAVVLPLLNNKKGFPARTRSTCPTSERKNAVARMIVAGTDDSSSNASNFNFSR